MSTLLENVLLVTIFLNLLMGVWVLLKNPRNVVHISFFILVFGISTWILGVILLFSTHNFSFDALALSGGLITFIGGSSFAYVFPSKKSIPLWFLFFILPIGIAFIFIPFHLYIEGIVIHSNRLVEPVNGPLFPLYVLIGLVYFVCAPLCFFVRNYRSATQLEKRQMLYLCAGMIVFIVGSLSFDVLLPFFDIYKLNTLGPLTSLVFIGLTSYAIVRHQLMDIRVIIQRGIIYSILLTFIVCTYISLLYLSESFFDEYEEITTPLYAGIVMLLGIITIPSIEQYFKRITDRIFFKDQYDYAKVLEELSEILHSHVSLEVLISKLIEKLEGIFRPEHIEFLFTQDTDVSAEATSETELSILISAQERDIGKFILGRKRSGDPYTHQDHQLLRTFRSQASIAFEKTELYETLEDYSKSLEETVYARTQKVKELSEQQRKLFDDISHALQTPLTVLKGGIESIKNRGLGKDSDLHPVEQSIDRLSRLIREILQLARIDAEPEVVVLSRVDLSSLVKGIVEYVEIICTQNDIQIHADIDQEVYIKGDVRQLEEILTNILSNAINYTTSCSVKNITVELRRCSPHIKLHVRDTGIGIPADNVEHIFDRFYRAHEKDATGKSGNGLGLAIVKRLVERHGGSIRAESILGKGTDMIVTLPENLEDT